MSYIYRLALAHREELLRQAAERRRTQQAIHTRRAPVITPSEPAPIGLRVLRFRRSATQG